MRRNAFLVVLLMWHPCQRTIAVEMGFSFSGEVLNVFENPFKAGLTTSSSAPVQGRVIYNSDSLPTDPIIGCDCMGYRQRIVGGFTATFGDVVVRADEYVVQIKNDMRQPGGVIVDTMSVRYSPGFDPSLAAPLLVEGSAYPESWFQVNIDAPNEIFLDASLPQLLDLHNFSSAYNFLDEVTTDPQIGVVFQNNSLSTLNLMRGDYDGDADVDVEDYENWRRTFGSTSKLGADGNRNGIVDAADFVVWRDNTRPTLGSAAVPEPRVFSLLILGEMFFGRYLKMAWKNRR
jgi:hypothetical protein